MAQVIEGGEFGVAFEGEELRDLLKLVEFAIVTTENVGVPVWELGEWKTALEEALTAPRDEEEVEEEKRIQVDPFCNLCHFPRSQHRNDATGKSQVLNERWPRWRCPPEFKTGGDVAGEGQFGEMEILPPEGTNAGKAPVRARRREE